MNDGNTAVQVSPVPTEDDMNRFRAFFDNALNSILAASKLSEQLQALTRDFESLKNDMEYVRTRNRELDQALSDVRSQRDTAMRERDEARQSLGAAKYDFEQAQSTIEANAKVILNLKTELEMVQKDRDQAYNEWHKADTRADKAEAKLADIQSFAKSAFGLTEPPKPVADPSVTPVPQDTAGVFSEPKSAEPTPETVVVPVKKRWDTDPGFDWSRPYEWDQSAGKYVQSFE